MAKLDETPLRDPYRLETVERACAVLRVFREGESLSLKRLVERTALNKTIVFRLVHTLEHTGLLRRVGRGTYRSNVRLMEPSRFRLGYAAQAEDSPFSRAVTASLRQAAAREGIELVVLDNRYSATVAVRNAERLVRERVALALEFQTFERAAAAVSHIFAEAGIPLVAIEVPHPGATFYGADNYRVGLSAGCTLGRWARQNWDGRVDEILLLEMHLAGALPGLRLTGSEAGIQETLGTVARPRLVRLDTRGDFGCSLDRVRKHLRHVPPGRTLIVGVNDPAVLGALRAFEECGRAADCVAIGLGAIPEARAELRRPGTRLIGSIAFFPERYGDDLIRLALDLVNRRHVPPAVYAHHQLVTPGNVDHYYGGDTSGPAELNTRPVLR